MALGGEIIDFVGLGFLDQANEIGCIRHVAIVKPQPHIRLMRIAIEMVDAACIKRRRPPLDAVNSVAFLKQQFREIGAILAGYTGDECYSAFAIR